MMKKIISLALICFMLFSTNATMYVNAESTESKYNDPGISYWI